MSALLSAGVGSNAAAPSSTSLSVQKQLLLNKSTVISWVQSTKGGVYGRPFFHLARRRTWHPPPFPGVCAGRAASHRLHSTGAT